MVVRWYKDGWLDDMIMRDDLLLYMRLRDYDLMGWIICSLISIIFNLFLKGVLQADGNQVKYISRHGPLEKSILITG